jgi:hypothetical protein
MAAPVKWRDQARELDAAIANVDAAVRQRLADLDIWIDLLTPPLSMVGVDRVRACGKRLYQPDETGAPAFITPVFVDNVLTSETLDPVPTARGGGHLVDLVAWREDGSWATRRGAAEWIGAIPPQYCDPPPAWVRRSILNWLKGGLHGLVLLSDNETEIWRILVDCLGGIYAADSAHKAKVNRLLDRTWPSPPVLLATKVLRAA